MEWKTAVLKAREEGTTQPEMPRALQYAILDVAKNTSNRFNFANYSYRDLIEAEMIEVLVKYPLGFDLAKGSNLFGYWSRFAFNAGRQRIKKEALQQKIKIKILKEINIHELLESEDDDNIAEFQEYINNHILVSNNNDDEVKPEPRKKRKTKESLADNLMAFATKEIDD
jgi:hypothetical protein